MKRTEIRLDHAALWFVGVYVFLVGVEALGLSIPIVAPVVGLVLFCFLLGALFLAAVGVRPRPNVSWVVYSAGTSLVVIAAVGLILNLFLPPLGYVEPLSFFPVVSAHLLLVLTLTAWLRLNGENRRVGVVWPESVEEIDPQLLFALLLPLLGILAITCLNIYQSNLPILGFLVLVAIVPLLVVLSYLDRHLPLLVWAIALGVLFHRSLWAGFSYDGHASVVGMWERGYWPLQGESLLMNAITLPSLAFLTNVHVLTMLKVILPVFISLIPVALYLAFSRFRPPKQAFLGACLYVFAHPFYFTILGAPRGSIPVLFLACLGVAISDEDLVAVHKHALSILFALGLIVSHYGTSYYVLFAIGGASVILYLFQKAREAEFPSRQFGRSENSPRYLDSAKATLQDHSLTETRVVTPSFSGFYLVTVLSYYLYVDNSSKFISLAEHIINAYVSLFVETGGRGSTATRLVTDYGSMSIQLSKYMYVAIGGLLGIGLLVVAGRQLLQRFEEEFSAEYLAMAVMLFIFFGGTFVIRKAWGGGRPMMIVLTFGAIFPVICVAWFGDGGRWLVKQLSSRFSNADGEVPERAFRIGSLGAFGVLLAVFLLLNTGVVSALVYGGEAPSNIPAEDVDSLYVERDIRTHAWFTDHRNESHEIYGDRVTRAQATDWMNGEIMARSENIPYRFRKKNFFDAVNDSDVEPGYLLLLSHNVADGRVTLSFVESRPIKEYHLSLTDRNKVYTSGAGTVYFHPEELNRSSES